MPDVIGVLNAVLGLVSSEWRGDAGVAEALASNPPVWSALGVAVAAWLSIGVGHVYVLFLNRVSRLRGLIAAALGLVYVLALRVLEALVTWGVATLVTGRPLPLTTVVAVFLLAMAPQVFAAFTFVPHFGLFLGHVLEAWSFLVLFLLLGAAYDIPAWQSLLVTGSGWLLVQVLSRLLAAPLGWLGSWVWTLASGEPTLVTSRDILAGTPFVPVEGRPSAERG